jgi:hypothetical protein
MKRVLFSVSACLVVAVSPALGLTGGPFGNDSSLSIGGSGTYQGIASGENLLGIAAFGFSTSNGSTGRYVFFHEGVRSAGDLQAIVDLPGRQIVGIMGGDLVEGQTTASGAFEAHIDSTRPILTATGTGEFTSPARPQIDTTKTITDTVTFSGTEDVGNIQIDKQGEVVTMVNIVLPIRKTVPFKISLTRTAVQVATFGAASAE